MTNKTVYSWLNPDLEVRETKKYGKGIFANADINKNELLAVFGGYILEIREEEFLSKECEDSGVQISDRFVITSKDSEEDTDFFNHSCSPNAGFNGQIFLVAMRKININEEVTFDYAMVLHSSEGASPYNMRCLCGSKECRGYITENDWNIPIIQKKYKGYFQCYLQELIDNKK